MIPQTPASNVEYYGEYRRKEKLGERSLVCRLCEAFNQLELPLKTIANVRIKENRGIWRYETVQGITAEFGEGVSLTWPLAAWEEPAQKLHDRHRGVREPLWPVIAACEADRRGIGFLPRVDIVGDSANDDKCTRPRLLRTRAPQAKGQNLGKQPRE